MSYYGEQQCQQPSLLCNNRAYYAVKEPVVLLCGVHARSAKKTGAATELPKRSAKDRARRDDETARATSAQIETARLNNVENGKPGTVILSQLRMRKAPDENRGFLKVFPNYKHQTRKDGFGCMRMSPMSLGPLEHGQPGLPPALNLENFHQGSKCFPNEVSADGSPSPVFRASRDKFYRDATPHRHKYERGMRPLYFVYVDSAGVEHRLDYIASRQFYCSFYETLVANEPDFLQLVSLRNGGTNLQICGYDSYPMTDIDATYLDPSKPFGHERVLYTMLSSADPATYPWRKYGNMLASVV